MKVSIIISIAVSVVALASCSSTKYISEGTVESITDAVIITPHTDVVFLENSETVLDMPEETAQLSDYIIKAIAESGLPVTKVEGVYVDDQDIEEALLSITGTEAKSFKTQPLPPALDQVLEDRGYRYGVFSLADGYVASKHYFRERAVRSVFLGVLTGILTLGTFVLYENVEKYGFNLWIAIADSETDKVIFYNSGVFQGWNPADAAKVEKAVKKLTKDFR